MVRFYFQLYHAAQSDLFQNRLGNTNSLRIASFNDLRCDNVAYLFAFT